MNFLKLKGYSKNALRTYCQNLRVYYEWIHQKEIKFDQITRRNIINFIDFLSNESGASRSPRTINNHLAILSSFYEYLETIPNDVIENSIRASKTGESFPQLYKQSYQHKKSITSKRNKRIDFKKIEFARNRNTLSNRGRNV